LVKTNRLLEQFEKAYRDEKKKEAEELHNAIAQVLDEHNAELPTVLFVLEMVKFELLREKYNHLFEAEPPGQEGPKPGQIAMGKPPVT